MVFRTPCEYNKFVVKSIFTANKPLKFRLIKNKLPRKVSVLFLGRFFSPPSRLQFFINAIAIR